MAAKKKVAPKKKAVSKKVATSEYSEFPVGLKYPWINMARLWNILWILIPILGWLSVIGYVKKITNELVNGNKAGLPEFGNFWHNLKEGFWVFVKLIPLMIVVWVLNLIPFIGWLITIFLWVFFLPYLLVHFLVRGDFAATFDYKEVIDKVFNNVGEYLIAFLKTLGFGLVYYVLSFVLVGIPCLYFGQTYFLAEFYAKFNK